LHPRNPCGIYHRAVGRASLAGLTRRHDVEPRRLGPECRYVMLP
jgi:hypothetical protein